MRVAAAVACGFIELTAYSRPVMTGRIVRVGESVRPSGFCGCDCGDDCGMAVRAMAPAATSAAAARIEVSVRIGSPWSWADHGRAEGQSQ
jgi:hypothetical protein